MLTSAWGCSGAQALGPPCVTIRTPGALDRCERYLSRSLWTAGRRQRQQRRQVVTDPADGSLLDYGRRTYRPPVGLDDHVRARDVTCRFPGCQQPARRCDLDHTEAYPAGPTSQDNLGALCRHHHRLKHETDWTLRQHQGTFTWTSPTGRTYTRAPEPITDPPDDPPPF